MISNINQFYEQQTPSIGACLMAARHLILNSDNQITEAWKYKMPFFMYRGKMICYLWLHKTLKQPYIGFVDGNLMDEIELLQENRSRMKILLLDAEKDLPTQLIKRLLEHAKVIKNKSLK